MAIPDDYWARYRGDDLSDPVDGWPDRSGNGLDLSIQGSGDEIVKVTEGPCDKPAARFAGGFNEFMRVDHDEVASDRITAFAMVDVDAEQDNDFGALVRVGGGGSGENVMTWRHQSGLTNMQGDDVQDGDRLQWDKSPEQTGFYIYEMSRRSDRFEFVLSGDFQEPDSVDVASMGEVNHSRIDVSDRLGGALFELIIWRRDLSSDERADVRSYMTQRYVTCAIPLRRAQRGDELVANRGARRRSQKGRQSGVALRRSQQVV